jgi:hypothetical protein
VVFYVVRKKNSEKQESSFLKKSFENEDKPKKNKRISRLK